MNRGICNFRAFAFLLCTIMATDTWAQWEELAGMPTARSEMSAAEWNARIYVPGGLGGMRKFEMFTPATNQWESLPPMPSGRHHNATVAYDGRIYVFGGADSTWTATDTAWAYDVADREWRSLANMPEPRYAAAGVALGGYLYVAGGDGPSGALLRYEPRKNSWTKLAPLRQRREHTTAAVLGNSIYILGGRWRGVGDLASVEVYDLASNVWSPAPSLNTARGGFGAVAHAGRLYAVGGEVLSGGRDTLDSVESYGAGEAAWKFGPPLPIALHGVPVVGLADHIYVLGGSNQAGGIVNYGRVFRILPE